MLHYGGDGLLHYGAAGLRHYGAAGRLHYGETELINYCSVTFYMYTKVGWRHCPGGALANFLRVRAPSTNWALDIQYIYLRM